MDLISEKRERESAPFPPIKKSISSISSISIGSYYIVNSQVK